MTRMIFLQKNLASVMITVAPGWLVEYYRPAIPIPSMSLVVVFVLVVLYVLCVMCVVGSGGCLVCLIYHVCRW